MRRLALTLVSSLAAASVAFVSAQTPAGSTPEVSIHVVDGTTHRPIGDAVVSMAGRGGPIRVVADSDGRVVARNLQVGPLTMSAAHFGFFGNGSDERDPAAPGRTIDITVGGGPEDVTLSLWKYGAISGIVTGQPDPLVGVEVLALRRTLVAGTWRFATFATTTTDDRGAYRFSALIPGEYIVLARPDRDPETPLLISLLAATPSSSADVMAAATASGRGIPERDATVRTFAASSSPRVTIDAATDRANIDFHLRAAHGVRVAGKLSGLNGLFEGVVVQLVATDSTIVSDPIETASAACDGEGRFEFANVAPGKYVVTVLMRPPAPAPVPAPPPAPGSPPPPPPPLPSEPTWWARTAVTVGAANITTLAVPVRAGFGVSGRVTFDGQAPAASAAEIAQIGLRLDSADQVAQPGAPPWRGVVSADGTFSTMTVAPGKYLLRVTNPPRGWTVDSVRVGSRDALDMPIELGAANVDGVTVTFRDRPFGSVAGTVHDAAGMPANGAIVLVFPATRDAGLDTSPQSRRLRLTRTSPTGSFVAGGLPDGAYLAIAVPDVRASEWADPARLDALASQASRVDVSAAPAQPVALTIVKTGAKR